MPPPLAVALLACLAVASADLTVREPALCCGWEPAADLLDAHSVVRFVVQVRERNLPRLRDIARSVSDPDSMDYGKYLKQAEIDELTSPAPADVRAVAAWLQSADGLRVAHREKQSAFVVEASVAAAARLLATSFRRLRNTRTQQTILRAATFTAPDAVAAVFGLHGLPLPPLAPYDLDAATAAAAAPPGKPADVTPSVFVDAYGVRGVTPSRSGANRQALAEFRGQTMNASDLRAFFARYVPSAQSGDDAVSKFVGDHGEGGAGTEASMDVQVRH